LRAVEDSSGGKTIIFPNLKKDIEGGVKRNPHDYFRKIKHINVKEIRDYISLFYTIIEEEYFLGILKDEVFDTSDERG